MLHEVLLALAGHSGNVIDTDPITKDMRVSPLTTIISPEQAVSLKRLCRIASFYVVLQKLVQTHQNVNRESGGVKDEMRVISIYSHALFDGVDEILNGYRTTLLHLEQLAMQSDDVTVCSLVHSLSDAEVQFPALVALVMRIIRNRHTGGALLNEVYRQTIQNGVTVVHNAMSIIFQKCVGVLLAQMTGWMLFGICQDPFEEFFIEHTTATAEDASPDDQFWSSFRCRNSMLPEFFNDRFAKKVLFIGKATQILHRHRPLPTQSRGAVSHNTDIRKFEVMMGELQRSEPFQPLQVESVVEQIRVSVAHRLWQMLANEAQLLHHLSAMRTFFLVGRGTLFQTFIEDSRAIMAFPPSRTASADLHGIFQATAAKDNCDEELIQRFQLKLIESEDQAKAWHGVSLQYQCEWPLSIFLSHSVLSKYDSLFRFLMLVTRAKVELQQTWLPLMSYRRAKREEYRISQQLIQLRHRMALLIDHLQFYLQVNVIDVNFSQLLKFIQTSGDFEAVLQRHNEYVDTLSTVIVGGNGVIFRRLEDILAVCLSFSAQLSRVKPFSSKAPELSTQVNMSSIQKIRLEFDRLVALLFTVISGITERQASAHLSQLLLRIDYNRFMQNTLQKAPNQ